MIGWILAAAVPLFYAFGVLSAVNAIMTTRTPQGATAWALALVSIPFVSLPLYWIFGRVKFDDYVHSVRNFDERIEGELADRRNSGLAHTFTNPEDGADIRTACELRAFRELATTPFTRGNSSKLLVDGQQTFEAIFAGIDSAESYVLAQYYIIQDDRIGRQFQEHLISAAERGVRVYLIYDDIGSHNLSNSYIEKLRSAGVAVSNFAGRRAWLGRFRLNFRNHRKIVVVDGVRGFMGGLNVGDEYLGRDESIGDWRDTHVEIRGPAVLGLQSSFLRDWYYGREEFPEVSWEPALQELNQTALVLASGPADKLETCGLLFTHAISCAEKRLWIASPYFVPDSGVLSALQLAALRGVDVRILMPRTTDNLLFKYVPYSYFPETERSGVKIYLYEKGFMHQKVMLIDNDYAVVGTANFDNRSFRLNFEITYMVNAEDACRAVEEMLEKDFENSTRLRKEDFDDRNFFFRFATQCTRLLAPIL